MFKKFKRRWNELYATEQAAIATITFAMIILIASLIGIFLTM